MSKKLKIYQVLTFALGLAFVALCLFVGITAVQKSMTLKLGLKMNPAMLCAIYVNDNLVFNNKTSEIASGVSLSANELKLDGTSTFGQVFSLRIENLNTYAVNIALSDCTINNNEGYETSLLAGGDTGNLAVSGAGLITITMTEAEVYYVQYNANNGGGEMTTSTHIIGASSALNANAFTAPSEDVDFAGWATTLTDAQNGVVTYEEGQVILNLGTTDGQTIQLYAVWKALEPFTFYTYEGSGHTAPTSRDGTAYKYYCEFGTYPQSYVGTDASIVNGMTEKSVTYAYDNAVKFYSQNGVNKYALVGSKYYAFEPIRWVVLGVDTSGGITFSGSGTSVTVASTTATLFTTSTSNLTLEDNRIKHNGVAQNKLLFLSELALDNEYFDADGSTNQWSNGSCDVRLFLNTTTNDMTNFASISGLYDYYDTSTTHVTGTYIQQTQIEKTSYYRQQEAADDGYYNMFLLGSNKSFDGDSDYHNWTDSYNIASYFPIYTGTAVTALKGNVTPFAIANGAYTSGGSATSNTLGSSYWWLRSGDYYDYNCAYIVFDDGRVIHDVVNFDIFAVRPSFVLNLA